MERYRGIEDVPSTRARRMHRYWLEKMPARSDIKLDLLEAERLPASEIVDKKA
jgi:hypothetical protein